MNELISVIVPIYNCEDYLKKCLDSILGQTYSNIELLLVDDGSTDKSKEICLNYSKNDKRIKIISKKNGGVSSARNLGLDNAKGTYVLFIDSDDYIDKTMIEKLYNGILNNKTDVSMCNILKTDEEGNVFFQTYNNDNEVITGKECMYNIFNYENAYCYPFNKLFKLEFLKKNRIKFDENLHFMEDFKFVCDAIDLTSNITNIQDSLYYYVHRKGSATHSEFNEKWLTRYDVQKEIIDKYIIKFSMKSRDLFLYDYVMNALSCYSFCKIHNKNGDNYKKSVRIIYKDIKNSSNIPKDKRIKIRLKYNFPMLYYHLLQLKNR